jgi:hypothetical protein
MAPHPQTLRAWLVLNLAFGVHAYEEAVTGFLPIYNQTAAEIRVRIPQLLISIFSRQEWLSRLGMGTALMLALSPEVYRGARWTSPLIRAVSAIMLANALLHVAGTICGRTFSSVRFSRPMPGFYSSPLLAAASLNLMAALRAEQRPNENLA